MFYNPMLLFIALFVWSGAAQEASLAQVRAVVSGACAKDAMVTCFHSVTPHTTLQEMAALMLSDAQQDFPVIKREHLAGMLSHADLLRALQTQSLDTPVVSLMRTDVPTVNEADLLDDILQRDREDDQVAIPVLKHGMLVGLLTTENMHEYLIIREAHAVSGSAVWVRGTRAVCIHQGT
jgi:stage IV sporulation protein FB